MNETALPIAYVGTLVGESTSEEFRLAIHAGSVREQDIIAVDADLQKPDTNEMEKIRVWAKVQRIERINPLFPQEAGHELAQTRTNPLDTVLSFSREMVTAVCRVLGYEPRDGTSEGRLDHLRYPAQPATSAYQPATLDLSRIVLGEMKEGRGLDLARLANRTDIDVKVDGHAVVTRHVAILAMTGAGKSWTARRLIEQLATKNYPIVIFDPHGDYARLHEIASLKGHVRRYYADFPVFEEDAETVASIVGTLGYDLSGSMQNLFGDVFQAAGAFITDDEQERRERSQWLGEAVSNPNISQYGIRSDLWLIANMARAAQLTIQKKDTEKQKYLLQFWRKVANYSGTDARTLEAISNRTYKAAKVLHRMAETNRKVADTHDPIPSDRSELVTYGRVSVVSLAGYTSDFQATIFSIIASDIFGKRVRGELAYQVLFVMEEAHNFAPAHATTSAEHRSIMVTRQIAQEGRKFGVGLVLISQRPSRLDETTLSQCNSQIIMRMINPADQNFVRRVVETLGDEDIRMLSGLDVGEAILAGQMTNFPVLARIKEPTSKGQREEGHDAFAILEKEHRSVTNRRQQRT